MPGQRLADIGTRAGDDIEHPSGRPACDASRASVRVVSGVIAGLMTTEQPAASAGITFQTAICSG